MEFSDSDKRQLRAAQGWLGLGDWKSANEELEQIAPALRGTSEVLQVRYEVYAAAKRWEGAADLSSSTVANHLRPFCAGLPKGFGCPALINNGKKYGGQPN